MNVVNIPFQWWIWDCDPF